MKRLLLNLIFLLPFFVIAQNVGIGTPFPTEKLHIDSGSVRIGNGVWSSDKKNWLYFGDGDYTRIGEKGDDSLFIFAKSITLNATDQIYSGVTKVEIKGNLSLANGSQAAGRILTCQGSDGASAWQDLVTPSSNTGFSATGSGSISVFSGSGSHSRLDLTTEEFDDGNNYGTYAGSPSSYIAPVAGVYHFDVNIEYYQSAATSSAYQISVVLATNAFATGYESFQTVFPNTGGTLHTISFGKDVKLIAGQGVTLYVSQNSGITLSVTGSRSNFSGHRIY